MPEKCEGWSRYQNSTGAGSPKSALEREDHVPKADHFNPIKSCLIKDDLHMRAHLPSKGHLLTPALKEIRWTRAERLFQWQAENGHDNILFTVEKILTIEEQYNKQNNTSSFLQEMGETGVRMYQKDVLQEVVKHLNLTLFSDQEWVF